MIRRLSEQEGSPPEAPASADPGLAADPALAGDAPSFRPALPAFAGPLDLLLYLIHKNEIDIFDIPIAGVLEQYLEHLSVLEAAGKLDLVTAGEFLVMATRLMEIKSRMLLPANVDLGDDEPLEEEIEDPRVSLVEQLLEYKEIKERAMLLQHAHRLRQQRFDRLQHLVAEDPEEKLDLGEASVFDLVAAFQRVLDDLRVRREEVQVIEVEDIPQEEVIQRVVALLETRGGTLEFRELFEPGMAIPILISYFLAVLEMTRLRVIAIRQPQEFGELTVVLRSASSAP